MIKRQGTLETRNKGAEENEGGIMMGTYTPNAVKSVEKRSYLLLLLRGIRT